MYDNLFQPAMRLIGKETVTDDERKTRIRRTYDDAKPPFDRLCATSAMSAQRREELERLRDATNPRRLRQEISALIDRIMDMPGADMVDAESQSDQSIIMTRRIGAR